MKLTWSNLHLLHKTYTLPRLFSKSMTNGANYSRTKNKTIACIRFDDSVNSTIILREKAKAKAKLALIINTASIINTQIGNVMKHSLS